MCLPKAVISVKHPVSFAATPLTEGNAEQILSMNRLLLRNRDRLPIFIVKPIYSKPICNREESC